MHYAGAHRVHRCAVRSCDVDPEVKRPRLPGDARVVEVAANRVGSVERLQRPGVHTASIPPTHSGARHVGRGRLPRVVRTRAGVSLRGASRRRAPSPPQLATWLACPTTYGGCRGVSLTRGGQSARQRLSGTGKGRPETRRLLIALGLWNRRPSMP